MPAEPLFLCVRKTLDWSDEAAVEAGLDPGFRPKLLAWNAAFTIPYHRFRQRLKEIAEASLRAVEGAVVARFDEVPDGAIVAPIDDDDWFAPDLARRLAAERAGGARLFLWTSHLLEARTERNPLRWLLGGRAAPRPDGSRHLCGSNNYAFVKGAAPGELLPSHVRASGHFAARAGETRRIDYAGSVQNRNLSSQTVLGWRRPTIGPARLLRRYRRYRRLYRRVELPPALLWARPHVDAMAALMDALRLRPDRGAAGTPPRP